MTDGGFLENFQKEVSMARHIVKWDPFKELASLREDMNRLFESFFERYPKEKTEGFWSPSIDVEETENKFVVKAELPGMKKENIKVSLSSDTLTISGEKERREEEKGKTYYRMERAYGKFQRTITLPAEIETDKAKVSYTDGILTLTLPKSEISKPREIPIQVE